MLGQINKATPSPSYMVDEPVAEDSWCYSSKTKAEIIEKSALILGQQMPLEQIQIIRLRDYYSENFYLQQKQEIAKFQLIELQYLEVPLIVTYQESLNQQIPYMIIRLDYVYLYLHEEYDISCLPIDKVVISQKSIQNSVLDCFQSKGFQRIKNKFDKIILQPFNLDHSETMSKGEMRLNTKKELFKLLSSFWQDLDKVMLLIPHFLPIDQILQIVELVFEIRIRLKKCTFKDFVVNIDKQYDSFRQPQYYLYTFRDSMLVEQHLKELLAVDHKGALEVINSGMLSDLLMTKQKLTLQYLSHFDPHQYETLRFYLDHGSKSCITSPIYSYGIDHSQMTSQENLQQDNLRESDYRLTVQHHRDSYFK